VTSAAVEALAWLLDEAYARSEHALLRNLEAVTDDQWEALPPGGARTIASIVGHVGECTYMYENHAFGDRSYFWDERVVAVPSIRLDVMAWLEEAHRRLLASIASLDDAGLAEERHPSWGAMRPTRGIVSRMDDRARSLPRRRDRPPEVVASRRRLVGVRPRLTRRRYASSRASASIESGPAPRNTSARAASPRTIESS